MFGHDRVIDGAASADADFSADVCVIGSGAGGAVSAAILAGAGLDVLLVEEGGLMTGTGTALREEVALPLLYQDGMQRATSDGGIGILQGRTVGGTTFVNWMTCLRIADETIAMWNDEFGVREVTSALLEPEFKALEARLAIQKVPETAMNRNNRLMFDGCRSLGWEVDTVSRNAFGCTELGACGLGCPTNAKRSMTVTFVPDMIENGGRLVHRLKIDRLVISEGSVQLAVGRFLGRDTLTPTGRTARIVAKRFVLSCGALNSPALLLRSGYSANGRVGARTYLHPATASFGLYDDVVDSHVGAPQSAVSRQFMDRGSDPGFFLECVPWTPALAATMLRGFGAEHRSMLRQYRQLAVHIAITIDGHTGEPGGRVRLRPTGAPVLDYALQPNQWRTLAYAQARLAEIALATGAREVLTMHDPPFAVRAASEIDEIADLRWEPLSAAVFSAHQMGGCAMGDEPGQSVVRSWDLRVHDIDNLHVIDGSVFPTSVGVNPQFTIFALARLAATRLAEQQATR